MGIGLIQGGPNSKVLCNAGCNAKMAQQTGLSHCGPWIKAGEAHKETERENSQRVPPEPGTEDAHSTGWAVIFVIQIWCYKSIIWCLTRVCYAV